MRRTLALFLVAVVAAGVFGLGCAAPGPDPQPAGVVAPAPAEQPPDRWAESADAAVGYLHRHLQPDGQFVYRTHLHPAVASAPAYNLVRHAGTMYALAQYAERTGDDALATDLLTPAAFLAEQIVPLPDHPGTAAVLTRLDPEDAEQLVDEMKLGASALALAALVQLETARPGSVDPQLLQSLGRFLMMMQEPDGRFWSKYYPDFNAHERQWVSLYYPGEAALGLLMLYECDGDPIWLDGAVRGLGYLARSRAEAPLEDIPPDHWALIATERLRPIYRHNDAPDVPWELLEHHAARVCGAILLRRPDYPPGHPYHGCMVEGGYTTPTATMMEGLLAGRNCLSPERGELRAEIDSAIHAGMAFLLRSQQRGGLADGAIPRRMLSPGQPWPSDTRDGEVRIDYVQHVLCAIMDYRAQGLAGQARAEAEH